MPAIKTVRPAVPVPPEIVERPGKSAPDNPLAFLSTEIQPINRKTEPVGTGWLSRRSLLVVALTVVIVTAAVALVSIVLNNYRSDAASHSPSTTPSTDEAMDAPQRPAVVLPAKPISRGERSPPESRPATLGIGKEATDRERNDSKPIQVEAETLSAEFQANSAAASAKWLTKSVEIHGQVKTTLQKGENELIDIGRGSGDGPVLIFDNGDKRYLVRCHLDSADVAKTEMTAAEAGDTATVDGVCAGVGRNALEFEAITGHGPGESPVGFGFIDIDKCRLVSVIKNSAERRKPGSNIAVQKDDPSSIVSKAKAAWQKALDDANADLVASFDKARKDAVAARDTSALQSIATDKYAFEQQQVYPRSKVMRPYLEAYLEKRAKAAEALIRAYDDAVKACKNQANAVDVDLATTIGDEEQAFSALELKTKDAIEAGKPLPEAQMNSVGFLNGLSKRLHLEIDAIATLDTSAKRDDAHAAMMHKLDTEMQKLSLTFRFPIKDVQHSRPEGQYAFSLSEPAEKATIGRCGYQEGVTLAFPASEIAKTHPGDILVFTGTPRLRAQTGGFGATVEGTISMVYLESPVTHQNYEIALQKYKVTIEHK